MISYTITVCNEDKELDNLLNFLEKKIKLEDEIVIQMDTIATTSDVRNVIENYRDTIFKKLEIKNRSALIVYGYENGILEITVPSNGN